jgi:DNA-binding HxlR family transcriptional regulator
MARKRFENMECGVAQALEQVGDWWTLLIIRDAHLGACRFGEFEESLGIAKNILSDRLQKLVRYEILEKRALDDSARHFEYRLTRKGRDLWVVLTALRLWSDKWVFGKGNEPHVARERETGRTVRRLLAVDGRGQPIDARKLLLVPSSETRVPGRRPSSRP